MFLKGLWTFQGRLRGDNTFRPNSYVATLVILPLHEQKSCWIEEAVRYLDAPLQEGSGEEEVLLGRQEEPEVRVGHQSIHLLL